MMIYDIPLRSLQYNTKYNIQKKVIRDILDTVLQNNDIHLIKYILSFLSDKCDHCKKTIINPRVIDGNKHICHKCVNYYIYCTKKNCKEIIHNLKSNDRCSRCLSWYCVKHIKKLCYCQPSELINI